MEIINQLPLPLIFMVCVAALFLLVLFIAICAAVNQWKKAFGKQPSFDTQMNTLRDDVMNRIAIHEADVKSRMSAHDEDDKQESTRLEGKIDKVDSDVRALKTSISDNGERRKTEMLKHIDEKHTHLQDQLNGIHTFMGKVSGFMEAMLK
jgi:hypothetical protein